MRNKYLFLALPMVSVTMISIDLWANVHTAASLSYTDVSATVAGANAGDTVMVPAGSATWANTLTIPKGIILIGGGIDKTVITNNIPWPQPYSNPPIIQYQPSNYDANDPFRLSGFTCNLGNHGHGITLGISGKKAPFTVQTKIRVDHNRFTNSASSSNQAIWNYGGVYGVVDNNIFDSIEYPIRNAPGVGGSSWWDNFTLTFGVADDNFYYEDNIFTDIDIVTDGQTSDRYVFRYNDISINNDAFPLFDMHGNAPYGTNDTGPLLGMYSTFGGELYGNHINEDGHSMDLLDQRAGKVLVFYNRVDGNNRPIKQVREECPDSEEPTSNPQPQHVSDSYYWNNRWNGSLINTVVGVEADRMATGGGSNYLNYSGSDLSAVAQVFCATLSRYGVILYAGTGARQARNIISASTTTLTVGPNWDVNPDSTTQFRVVDDFNGNTIHENSEFFTQGTSFNGSAAVNTLDGPAMATGMGCGPLANRPTTCTPGVAYWATNQDCSQVSDDNVGMHPKTPISGTLYKCTAPNVWTTYYTPYPYPHPLRVSGPVADEPTSISPKLIQQPGIPNDSRPGAISIVRSGRNIFIRVPGDGAKRMIITTLDGRIIATIRVSENQSLIRLDRTEQRSLTQGIYMVTVTTKNGMTQQARLAGD